MDRQKAKKIRSARVIATNIFMGIAVIAIVAVLMLVSMGFSFSGNGNVEQSGLLQLASTPSRATVTIDNNQLFTPTTVNKMLSAGQHDLKISKPGYDTWQKHIDLEAGLLTHIEWIRLFPLNQEIDTAAVFQNNLRLSAFSSDRKQLLTSAEDATSLYVYNIQDPNLKHSKLDLQTVLDAEDAIVRFGALKVEDWSDSNIILRWTRPDDQTVSWHLADLDDTTKSTNLNTTLSDLSIQQVFFANSAGNRLWLRANDKLYFIDLSSQKLSAVLAQNVEQIYARGGIVLYVATVHSDLKCLDDNNTGDDMTKCSGSADQRALFSLRDGDTAPVKLLDLKSDDQIHFAFGDYWGDDWLAYSLNDQVIVQSGHIPSAGQKESQLHTIIERDSLPFTPQYVSVSPNSRIIAFSSDQQSVALDVETHHSYDISAAPITEQSWLDDFMFWYINDENQLSVVDFDGDNQRTIIDSADSPRHAVISNNNKWLYYFESAPADADYQLSLKRLNLNI